MSPNASEIAKRPSGAGRPFPWRCHHCGNDAVELTSMSYDAQVSHDGGLHTVTVPRLEIPVCRACGEKVFTETVDAQINAALHIHLHLLTADEIHAALARIAMTQAEAAEHLGIAQTTLSCWLGATQIQSRAMDNLLRVFFGFPQVRLALQEECRQRQRA